MWGGRYQSLLCPLQDVGCPPDLACIPMGMSLLGLALGRKLPLCPTVKAPVTVEASAGREEEEQAWLARCLGVSTVPLFELHCLDHLCWELFSVGRVRTEPSLCSPQRRQVSGLEGPLSARGCESAKPLQWASPSANPEEVERPSGACFRKALPQFPSIHGLMSQKETSWRVSWGQFHALSHHGGSIPAQASEQACRHLGC